MGLTQVEYLGLFLLGLYIGRRRVFEDVAAHQRTLRRVATQLVVSRLWLSRFGLRGGVSQHPRP